MAFYINPFFNSSINKDEKVFLRYFKENRFTVTQRRQMENTDTKEEQ